MTSLGGSPVESRAGLSPPTFSLSFPPPVPKHSYVPGPSLEERLKTKTNALENVMCCVVEFKCVKVSEIFSVLTQTILVN